MANGTPPSVDPADDPPRDHPRPPKPIVSRGAGPFRPRYYTARDLSRLTGFSLRTIKHYRDQGIIAPPCGPGGRGAYYDVEHLRQLNVVLRAKAERLTSDDLAALLALAQERHARDRTPIESTIAAERPAIAARKMAALRSRRAAHERPSG